MMRTPLFTVTGLLVAGFIMLSFAMRGDDGWKLFAQVKFSSRYYKAYKEYFLTPSFTESVRALEGKEMMLRGHFLPLELKEKDAIVISKYPYAACFFCGGAGPESVAEINFATRPPKLKADQIITVKGMLKLNDTDVEHLNFILIEAEWVKQ